MTRGMGSLGHYFAYSPRSRDICCIAIRGSEEHGHLYSRKLDCGVHPSHFHGSARMHTRPIKK
uniref:Uncharacterized protein n=1 Tax=Rhizophora mucronata TaxID=61149 RepID=A0A2P2PIH1_RHIMU